MLLSLAGCAAVSPSPLASAARGGDLEGIRHRAHAGASLNAPSGVNGWTPLHHAIHKYQPGSVSMLLELGADVNARSPNMMAAGYGYKPIVLVLLDHQADPSLKDVHGETAMDYAKRGVTDIDRWTWPTGEPACVRILQAAARY
jgi:uncharacterized protein